MSFPLRFSSYFCLDTKVSKNQAPTAVGVDGGLFINAAPFAPKVSRRGMVHYAHRR